MAPKVEKTASVLAFERHIDPSDAVFASGNWEQRGDEAAFQPVRLREKAVRGTISNRLKTKDQDTFKLDAAIENPNLQRVDVAALPSDADTLRVRFTLRILPGLGVPCACNNPDYQKKLAALVAQVIKEDGLKELGQRYAWNLANGRFLWRNRLGAQEVEVRVKRIANSFSGAKAENWTFPALDYSLAIFEPAASKDIKNLGALISAALAGGKPELFEVTAYVRAGAGQEVYPSQELILDSSASGSGKKSRILYEVGPQDDRIAAMHSQKIGNALRTIDTWYPNAQENGNHPIAVEPYGSVTVQGKAWRQPKDKRDFYNLLDHWMLKDEAPENEGDRHFVMAVLARGGVFGDAGKE